MPDPPGDRATNDQIVDAVRQVSALTLGADPAFQRALNYQVLTQAVGLAMQNAVAQQKQRYILRNALVTAAARRLLESDPAKVLGFLDEVHTSDETARVLSRLQEMMADVESRQGRPNRDRARAAAAADAGDGQSAHTAAKNKRKAVKKREKGAAAKKGRPSGGRK